MDQSTQQEIESLLKSGKKLAAIKCYRKATGASLAASKQAVERMSEQDGLPAASRIGCLGVIVVAIVALEVLAVSLV